MILKKLIKKEKVSLRYGRSYLAESVRSGIGSVFRDHFGNIFFHFSKHWSSDLSISVEISAIRKSLLIAVASKWSWSAHFLVKLDLWMLSPDLRTCAWCHEDLKISLGKACKDLSLKFRDLYFILGALVMMRSMSSLILGLKVLVSWILFRFAILLCSDF